MKTRGTEAGEKLSEVSAIRTRGNPSSRNRGNHIKKLDVVINTCNPSTEAEMGGPPRPADRLA